MGKNKGKKPGEHAEARKRHLQRQVRQDALNRLKAGETVSIMAYTGDGYERFTVAPLGPGEPFSGSKVIVLMEGKIWAADYTDKDGCRVYGSGKTYHVPADKVFGAVIQEGA